MIQISLASARVNAGYKQDEAAKKAHIAPKSLGNYERGITMIPAHILRRLSKLYNIPSDNIRLPKIDDDGFDEDEKNLNLTTV